MFSVSKNYTIYVLKVGVSCNVYCILIELLSSSRILELEHGYISPWFEWGKILYWNFSKEKDDP